LELGVSSRDCDWVGGPPEERKTIATLIFEMLK
jgi:hypothetical protein